MAWYHYHQNNSGGSWRSDTARGIGHDVWVEGRDAADANQRAERIGLYFDGCSRGLDCACCGDRWSEAWDYADDDRGDGFDGLSIGYYRPSEGQPVYLHPIGGAFITLTYDMPHGPDDVRRLVESRGHERDEQFVRGWIAKHGAPNDDPADLLPLAGEA